MRYGKYSPFTMRYTYWSSVGTGLLLHVTHSNSFKMILISYHHISKGGIFLFFLLMSPDSGVLPTCGLPFLRKSSISQYQSESMRTYSLFKLICHLTDRHIRCHIFQNSKHYLYQGRLVYKTASHFNVTHLLGFTACPQKYYLGLI